MRVYTASVDAIAPARASVNRLVTRGMSFRNGMPDYEFTGLNAIKTDMLREATTQARLAANEFAQNAGAAVAGIRHASGSFSIRDIGSGNSRDKMESGHNDRVLPGKLAHIERLACDWIRLHADAGCIDHRHN